MTGVSAAAIASPSLGEVSLGMPQPSMTTILNVNDYILLGLSKVCT